MTTCPRLRVPRLTNNLNPETEAEAEIDPEAGPEAGPGLRLVLRFFMAWIAVQGPRASTPPWVHYPGTPPWVHHPVHPPVLIHAGRLHTAHKTVVGLTNLR